MRGRAIGQAQRLADAAGPWRVLPLQIGDSEMNVALSDALVRHSTVPSLWWHATDQPTLILGAGQRWTDVDLDACERSGVRVVKREAGGTAVFAGSAVLALDVVLPKGHPLADPDVVEAYKWFGEVWVDAIRSLGTQARMVSIVEARESVASRRGSTAASFACFASLSPYEVAVGKRKLVGFAQVRRRGATLLQAGLHLHFDAAGLAALLDPTDDQRVGLALGSAAVGLDEVQVRPISRAQVKESFEQCLRGRYAIDLQPGIWSASELQCAASREPARNLKRSTDTA